MQHMTIQLDRDAGDYVPGEPITGSVSWDLPEGPERVTVRLLWQTEGKGTQDVGVVGETVWDLVSVRERRDFSFPGVEGPYSFSGQLITLRWMVEAVAEPNDAHAEQPMTISPTGTEVRP